MQIKPEPIKETIKHIQKRLNFFEKAETRQKANNNSLIFKYTSESGLPVKLKVEINCRDTIHYMATKTLRSMSITPGLQEKPL